MVAKRKENAVDPILRGGRVAYVMQKGAADEKPTFWFKIHDQETGEEVARVRRKFSTATAASNEATDWMRRAERDDGHREDPTVGEVIEAYLVRRETRWRKPLSAKTKKLNREEQAVLPATIKTIKVSKLTGKHIEEADDHMDDAGYSDRTRGKAMILLRAAWRYGVSKGTINLPCPADGYIITVPPKEADPLTPEQEKAFWNAAVAHAEASPPWSQARRDLVAISLMLHQGFRIGEAVATRPEDVDGGRITMAGHVVPTDDGPRWVPGSKNGVGDVRTVPLMGPARGLVERAVAEAGEVDGPLLSTRERSWMDTNNLRRTCKIIVAEANRIARDADPEYDPDDEDYEPLITGFKPHRLRDMFGTRMGASGCEVRTLSALMGHHTPAMTYKYVKVLAPGMQDAADAYEAKNPTADVPLTGASDGKPEVAE